MSSPSTPSILLGVPDVSRLRPVQGALSKAREELGFAAQSKSIERMVGRGRQSANPRITGGLVSSTRGNASPPPRSAPRMRPRAANGQQRLLLGLLARDPLCSPATYGGSQCGGQHIAPTRRGRRGAASVSGLEHRRARLEPWARTEGCAGRPLCLEQPPGGDLGVGSGHLAHWHSSSARVRLVDGGP